MSLDENTVKLTENYLNSDKYRDPKIIFLKIQMEGKIRAIAAKERTR